MISTGNGAPAAVADPHRLGLGDEVADGKHQAVATDEDAVARPLRAERLAPVQQEQRKQRPLLTARERQPAALSEDLDRTEDAEFHAKAEPS